MFRAGTKEENISIVRDINVFITQASDIRQKLLTRLRQNLKLLIEQENFSKCLSLVYCEGTEALS